MRLFRQAKAHATILFGLVGVLWLEELLDATMFQGRLDQYGIRPRDTTWLWGILFAPFLHGGWAHLIANTGPLLVLGWLVLLRGVRDFLLSSVAIVLAGGLGIWLFGRPNTLHLGASILIFGYLGFVLLRAYYTRNLPSIALALVAVALYGGALWGVLPGQRGISWEGHLFGFGGGAVAARMARRDPATARLSRGTATRARLRV